MALRPFSEERRSFAGGGSSPREFVERCLAGIAARESVLRCFVSLAEADARAEADASARRYREGRPLSPIDGCPVGIKDIIETANMPTQMGSPLYEGFRSGQDAACVEALRRAGAVVVGKTHTTEFAVGRSAPTRNPRDTDRTPGGSSSGSGAAVGAGLLPAALATQTAGSILRPASYCGAYGFKPTHGTLPLAGVHPLSRTLDHLGVLAASLDDAWETAHAIWRYTGADRWPLGICAAACPAPVPPRRLGWLRTDGWPDLDERSAAAFAEWLDRVQACSVEVADARGDAAVRSIEEKLRGAGALNTDLMRFEMRHPMQQYYDRDAARLGERLRTHIEEGARMDAYDHRALLSRRREIRETVAAARGHVDAFVTLASTGPAPPGLEYTGDRTFLSPWSVSGGPAFSLPLLESGGLPLGVQVMGFEGEDAALAGTAAWLVENAGRQVTPESGSG